MKKFILTVLCTAIFFLGLGGLFEKASARLKSDEKALTLIRQAREAIGGDANISSVRSFSATGKITKTLNFEGASRVEQGDWELNLQLPNQISQAMKLRRADGGETSERQEFVRKENIVVIKKDDGENKTFVMPEPANGGEKKVFVIKRNDGELPVVNGDGANADGKKIFVNKDIKIDGDAAKNHQNELFQLTLALLLTAPEGSDVSYTYAGEGTVDGNSCDIVDASTGASAVKLYLDKSTHLPRMISYQGTKPFVIKFKKDDAANGDKQQTVLVRTSGAPETSEFQIRFSDYRNVNGVQLPYRWTQTVGGKDDELIDITNYEINPANIAEKFNKEPQKILFRTAKPQ